MTPTPDLLRATYEFLRHTKPFCDWKLPDGEQVGFVALKTTKRGARNSCYGSYVDAVIGVSPLGAATPHILLKTMAHEMCHMALDMVDVREKDEHGPRWRAAARDVCRHHGFDMDPF